MITDRDYIFCYMFRDGTESLFYKDKVWNVEYPKKVELEDFYKDYLDKNTNTIYYNLDWDSFADEEEKGIYTMGNVEELKPIWEDAKQMAFYYKGIYEALKDMGFKPKELVILKVPVKIGNVLIDRIYLDEEGIITPRGHFPCEGKGIYNISFESQEEYEKLLRCIYNNDQKFSYNESVFA